MGFKIGDYLIIGQDVDGKYSKKLIRVSNNKKNVGIIENENTIKNPDSLSFEDSEVLANLGKNPEYGNVYGIKVAPTYSQKSLNPYRGITWKRKATDKEKEHINSLLKRWAGIASKEGIDSQIGLINIEILPAGGRWDGMYHYTADEYDNMLLHPDNLMDTGMYLIAHEFGHHIWYRHLSIDKMAEWIQLYTKYVDHNKVKKNNIHRYLKKLEKYSSIKDFLSEENDENNYAKFFISHLLEVSSLTTDNINDLLDTGNFKADRWKKYMGTLAWGDAKPVITDYASTSVYEFFAEAFAYYMAPATSVKLPIEVKKAMRTTLKDLPEDKE